ncbi:cytochrome P450 [Butyriboletus roseoflavus]|nr:cytochrome P450 [Butyriboletus roseoflavus]
MVRTVWYAPALRGVLHMPYIVINDDKVCYDLLEKRSNIYSDRPRNTMAKDLMGWGFTTLMKPYGEVWRQHRKLLHQFLNVRDQQTNRNLQRRAVHEFLKRLGANSTNFLDQIKHLAGSIIMKIAYGYELVPSDDYYVSLVEHAVEGLMATFGVGFMVDLLPILKYVPSWMPGATFQRLASQWLKSVTNMVNMPWDDMMQKYRNGVSPACYSCSMIDENGGTSCDLQTMLLIKETAATLYAAGADSASSVISSFMLAMTLHPEIFSEAQAEIDLTIGRDRLPDLSDREKLPCLECIIKEVYRWNPPAPIGAAHRLIEDDFYNGYLIPKGTTVIANIWAMTHDPRVYPDPTKFDPHRFAGERPCPDPRLFVFGFGRRRCIGEGFADSLVFLALSSIVSCFNIRRAIVDGKEVEPRVSYPYFVGHPAPFDTRIEIRDCVSQALIDAAVGSEVEEL